MRATNPGFVPDSPFTRPLPEAWTEFFSRFPKARTALPPARHDHEVDL